jgi:probable ATP-dependent RNA helicase DDX4
VRYGGLLGDEKRPPPYVPPPLPEGEENIFATIQKGINFDKYDIIPVGCTGSNAPKQGISR